MPYKARRGCLTPGCPDLADGGSYCAFHQREQDRQYDRARGSAAARGYDRRWQRIRAWHLRRNPICVDPFEVHDTLTLATTVDHIQPRSHGGTDRGENLRSVCASCHGRIHAEQGERWPS